MSLTANYAQIRAPNLRLKSELTLQTAHCPLGRYHLHNASMLSRMSQTIVASATAQSVSATTVRLAELILPTPAVTTRTRIHDVLVLYYPP